MKWNTILLGVGLMGLGVVGATQGLRASEPEAQTSYWASGALRSRSELRDGIPEGLSQRWYRDGTREAEGGLTAGRMQGKWEFWLPDGTPDAQRTGLYRAGARAGEGEDAARGG